MTLCYFQVENSNFDMYESSSIIKVKNIVYEGNIKFI